MASGETLLLSPGSGNTQQRKDGALSHNLRKVGLLNKPDAEFNNFYTPENAFFHSKLPYQRLNHARREIRLLRVLPHRRSYRKHISNHPQWANLVDKATRLRMEESYGDFGLADCDTPLLACELLDNVQLSSVSGTYCTISYCAGSPTKTAVMIVDGLPFMAFANLEHAIECALKSRAQRRHADGRNGQSTDLLLWADQICINQLDNMERSSQVAMMCDIYRRCDETFVCLSTPGSKHISDGSWLSDGLTSRTLSRHMETWIWKQLRPLDPDLRASNRMDMAHKITLRTPQAPIWSFLDSPWWRRSWVFQEFVASPKPVLVVHSKSMLWKDFEAMLEFLSSPAFRNIVDDEVASVEAKIAAARHRAELAVWAQPRRKHLDTLRDEFRHAKEVNKGYQTSVREFAKIQKREWEQYIQLLLADLEKEGSQLDESKKSRHSFLSQTASPVRAHAHRSAILKALATQPAPKTPYPTTSERFTTYYTSCRCKVWTVRHKPVYTFEENGTWNSKLSPRLPCGCPWGRPSDCAELNSIIAGFSCSVSKPPVPRPVDTRMQKATDTWVPFPITFRESGMFTGDGLESPLDHSEDYYVVRPFEHWWCELQKANHLCFQSSRPPVPLYRTRYNIRRPLPQAVINGANTQISEEDARRLMKMLTTWQAEAKHAIQLHPVVASMLEMKRRHRGQCEDLKPLLQHARHCTASDPRDRVYAFVGLVPQAYGIVPDYANSNTVVHVLLDAAQKMVQTEESLGLLRYTFRGREGLGNRLPSWVPDWTSRGNDDIGNCVLSFCAEASKYDFGYRSLASQIRALLQPSKANLGQMKPVFRRDPTGETNLDLMVEGSLFDTLDFEEAKGEGESGNADTAAGRGVAGFPALRKWRLAKSDKLRAVTLSMALAGDQIWILQGASLPVLLRPEGDDSLYSFCGEVVLLTSRGKLSNAMISGKATAMASRSLSEKKTDLAEKKTIWIL